MGKLDEKEIDALFFDCLFAKNEIIDGRPISELSSIPSDAPNYEGRCPIIGFSTNRLNRNKQRIIQIINSLSKIDEGSKWEDLYYDNEGIKWCSDIKSLDQLIMMGKACGLLTHTIIQAGCEEDIVIIKRNRENDNLTIKGSDPCNLPIKKDKALSKQKYTEEELKIIRLNKKRISNDLKRDIKIIKTGLGFFGIKVEINAEKENQLDIFDSENNLITNYVIEDTNGIVGFGAILGQRLNIEFKDNRENEITYCYSDDSKSNDEGDIGRHIFLLSSQNKLGYRIEIGNGNRFSSNPPKISVRTINGNADYVIKRFDIDSYQLIVELNNAFGPYGNYENGTKRHLWYRNTMLKPHNEENLLFMIEEEQFDKGHFLSGDNNGIRIDKNNLTGYLSREMFHSISSQIVAHPRNQELILFTINELDKQLPGIKNFISNNYPLYKNTIRTFGSTISPQVDSLVKLVIHSNCNLPEGTVTKIKKQ